MDDDIKEDREHKCSSLDLSNRAIETLPASISSNLQYLYLENNGLKELPESLFVDLPSLKWLDVRNNCIEKIPDSIENHKCVETMLLQNNRISYLPLALATANALKRLHLSGNPIIYPKRSVVNAGTEALLSYLRSELSKRSSTAKKFLDVTFDEVKDDIVRCSRESPEEQECSRSNVKPPDTSEQSQPGRLFKLCAKNTDRYLKNVNKIGDDCGAIVVEKLAKEQWLKERKKLLSKREKILQNRRSLEALKNWRKQYGESKVDSEKMYYALNLSNIPYDTDLNYVKILTRADIEKDLPDKYKKDIRSKLRQSKFSNERPNVQTKIESVIENMKTIGTESCDWSPRTERKMISCEIKMLSDIKKQIDVLKSENDFSTLQ